MAEFLYQYISFGCVIRVPLISNGGGAMASPKSPMQQVLLPLVDPDNVDEVLVTELTGTCVLAGNLHMEMSIARPHHESSAGGVTAIKQKRVVRLRPVLPLAAVPDMINQLQQIMQQEAARTSATPPKAN